MKDTFREILDQIQKIIEAGNGATKSELKNLWNSLSNAITAEETASTESLKHFNPDRSAKEFNLRMHINKMQILYDNLVNPDTDEKKVKVIDVMKETAIQYNFLAKRVNELESELAADRGDEQEQPQPFDYQKALAGEKMECRHTLSKGWVSIKLVGLCGDGSIACEDENGFLFKLISKNLRMAAKSIEYKTLWVNLYSTTYVIYNTKAEADAASAGTITQFGRAFPIRIPKTP